ncbi:MAG: hypothetical protein ACTSUE_02475 [Promethearchaeota archaeon]
MVVKEGERQISTVKGNLAASIVVHVPSIMKFQKGSCFLLPRKNGTLFLVNEGSMVFLLKSKCLSCFHFRIKNGCGVGSDCKSICLIPEARNQGWTNVPDMSFLMILVVSKVFTLLEEPLQPFISEQIPRDFHQHACKKYIYIKPIVYRILVDLDKQAEDVEARYRSNSLPLEQRMKFLKEILDEREELKDRLAIMI